ncbi:MAG TPA: ABC transporter permease [Glaciihabitans sp.]|nr:ABC transporter permease [Glaciihabitans sp.]
MTNLNTAAVVVAPPTDIRVNRTWQRLRRNFTFWAGSALVLFFVFISLFPAPIAGLFGNGNPRLCGLEFSGQAPSPGHPFGYTTLGCDLYSSVIYGAQASIGVGLLVTLGTCVVAIIFGTLAGYFGGWVDSLISRFSEIVFAVPLLLGAIVILNSIEGRTVIALSAVLIVFAWPTSMRIMRSSVLSVRNRSFVVAATSLGLSTPRILWVHVLPNTLGPILVLATLQIGAIIAAEATLTYLGIGLQPPALSWGLQLSSAQNYFQASPHLLIFPALMLTLAVTGFVMLGEAVRGATKMGSAT